MDHVPGQFVVQFQDFSRHQFGDAKPPMRRETYATRDMAEARKANLQASGHIACVTPLYVRAKTTRDMLAGSDMPPSPPGMKLTR